MKTGSTYTKIVTLAVYAIAMAVVEMAVVVYLRELYYPTGFFIQSATDLSVLPSKILTIELWREVATIVMIATVAYLAFSSRTMRLGAFIWAFSVWDLTYYLFLYIFLRWPSSLNTIDVYFLIPWPSLGPVWFPIILFGGGAIVSLWLMAKNKINE